MHESGNRWAVILCDVDAGSIKSGPSNVRDHWLSVLTAQWPDHPPPLFIDRRHGQIAARLVESYCFAAVTAGLTPLVLGGDHATTYFAYSGVRQAIKAMPDLIHFDAHHDAWPAENITNYSFARHLRRQGVVVDSIGMREKWPSGMPSRRPARESELVYLSIDVDVLDPQILSAVSFPVPIGSHGPNTNLEWLGNQLNDAVDGRRLVAADIVEWVPMAAPDDPGDDVVGGVLSSVLQLPGLYGEDVTNQNTGSHAH